MDKRLDFYRQNELKHFLKIDAVYDFVDATIYTKYSDDFAKELDKNGIVYSSAPYSSNTEFRITHINNNILKKLFVAIDADDKVFQYVGIEPKSFNRDQLIQYYSMFLSKEEAEKFRLKNKTVNKQLSEQDMIQVIKTAFADSPDYIEACIKHKDELVYTVGPYAEFYNDMQIANAKEFDIKDNIRLGIQLRSDDSWSPKTNWLVSIPVTIHCICGAPKYTSYGNGFKYSHVLSRSKSKSVSNFGDCVNNAIHKFIENNNAKDLFDNAEYCLACKSDRISSLINDGVWYYRKDPNIMYNLNLRYAFNKEELEKAINSIADYKFDPSNIDSDIIKSNNAYLEKVYDLFVQTGEYTNIKCPNIIDTYINKTGVFKLVLKTNTGDIPLAVLEYNNLIASFIVIEVYDERTNIILNNDKNISNFIELLLDNSEIVDSDRYFVLDLLSKI